MDRRDFTRGLIVSAVATHSTVTCPPASACDDPPAPSTTDQLLGVLKARYGDRLTDEQWKQVRSKLDAQLGTAKALGEFKLQNGDEPATVFTAVRTARHENQ